MNKVNLEVTLMLLHQTQLLEAYVQEQELEQNISLEDIRSFIKNLEIDENDKNTLLELTPENYIGLSATLVEKLKI